MPDLNPTFRRQQYAADAGGPIRHDKACWFVAMEDRQQLGADLVGTTSQTITRQFATAPLHDYLTTERLDWQLTERDRSVSVGPWNSKTILVKVPWIARLAQLHTVRRLSVIFKGSRPIGFTPSPRLLSTASALPTITSSTPPRLPPIRRRLLIPTVDDGATYRVPQQTLKFRLQGDDMLTWSRHNHTLSFGGGSQSIAADFNLGVFQQGNIQTVEDFSDYDRNGDGKVDDNDLLFAVGLRSSTPTRPLDLPNNDNYHLGLFAQDEWKALPNSLLTSACAGRQTPTSITSAGMGAQSH